MFVIFACGVGGGLQFAKTSVLFDALSRHYAASPATIGWFISAVGLAGVAFGATAGLIVGRIGIRVALIGSLIGGAVLSLLEALLPPAPLFVALRALEGLSQLGIVVAGPTCVTGLATIRDRPLALGLWGTFMSVAFLVAGLFARPLAEGFGLASPFFVHGVVMLVLAVAAYRIAPATERSVTSDARSLIGQHVDLYVDPRSQGPAICWLAYTGMYLALQTLTPQLAPAELRSAIIVGMAFMSICASLFAGALAHRGFSPFALTAGAFVATLAASVLVQFAVGGRLIAPAALFRMAMLSLLPGAILPMIPKLNPDTPGQARAFGAMAQTGNVGSALGPPLFATSQSAFGPVGLFLPAAALCALGFAMTLRAGSGAPARSGRPSEDQRT